MTIKSEVNLAASLQWLAVWAVSKHYIQCSKKYNGLIGDSGYE